MRMSPPSSALQLPSKCPPDAPEVMKTFPTLDSLLAGRLSYDMDPQKKQLSVHVTDMRQGQDYHLRLCRRDFICIGTGAKTLVRCSPAHFEVEVLKHNEKNRIMLDGPACPLRSKRRKQSRASSYHIPDLCPAFASRYD